MDIDEIKKQFENFKMGDFCVSGDCDENEQNLGEFPEYTDALYQKLMAPHVSGVYISRMDLLRISDSIGERLAINPRKRMFEMLMKYTINKEEMQVFLDVMEQHILAKIDVYEEMIEEFEYAKEIYEPLIIKARNTINLFPAILKEYF